MPANQKEQKGILIIQSLGVGDVLFAVPVVRVLKRHYPDDPITFLTSAQNAGLLSLVPEVDTILSYGSKTATALLRLVREIRCSPYRMAVVLNPILRGSLLARCSGAPVRIGYRHDYERKQSMWGLRCALLTHSYVPRDEKLHEVERYLDLLRMFGLAVREEELLPRLTLTEKARAFGQMTARRLINSRAGPLVVMNPGAGWELKQWPYERFAAVGDWAIERFGAHVLFVGAAQEVALSERIRGVMARESVSYVGRTSLPQLAGLLSQCDLVLTNDTGALHIAAALDVPTIALFGPGDPEKFRPLSRQATVFYHQVPCSPCKVQYTDKCHDNICMQQITVDEVKVAITKTLGEKRRNRVVSQDEAGSGVS